MLTVADLIAQLQQLDQTLPVLVDGYEGGYQSPFVYQDSFVTLGKRSYMGDIDKAEYARWEIEDGAKPYPGLLISRMPR